MATTAAAPFFLFLSSSFLVAFKAGLTTPGLVPVAVFDFVPGFEGLDFDAVNFDGAGFEPLFVNGVLAAAGLEVFVFATSDFAFCLAGFALTAFDFADDLEAAFEELDFFAIGFDEGPLVAGFFTGLGVDLLFAAFLVAGFTAVFFLDALATAFTNHC